MPSLQSSSSSPVGGEAKGAAAAAGRRQGRGAAAASKSPQGTEKATATMATTITATMMTKKKEETELNNGESVVGEERKEEKAATAAAVVVLRSRRKSIQKGEGEAGEVEEERLIRVLPALENGATKREPETQTQAETKTELETRTPMQMETQAEVQVESRKRKRGGDIGDPIDPSSRVLIESIMRRRSPRLLSIVSVPGESKTESNLKPPSASRRPGKQNGASSNGKNGNSSSNHLNGCNEDPEDPLNGTPTNEHATASISPEDAHSDAAKKIKETLKIFNVCYLRCVQEEEERCRKEDVAQSKKKKPGSKDDCEDSQKKSRRPDLKAINLMNKERTLLHATKLLGGIPGVNVGDQFFSRCEMIAIGLHAHWLAGIDYIGTNSRKSSMNYNPPVATSIVLSGMYEDDFDNSNDVVYTGQGGNDLLGNKRQIADQVMERGNLALKNSMLQDLPVRVIRGHKTKKSYSGKVYTYDGIYKVKEFWAEKGISGFTVYKFRLCRIEGQPQLATGQVHYCRGQVPSCTAELRGMVSPDISGGLEKVPIPASNLIDNPPLPPTGYKYLAEIEVDKSIPEQMSAKGCNCVGQCVDANKCACAILNGKKFPYVSKNGGRLVEPFDVVYECGPNCKCGPTCSNRVSQKGISYRLEVFRTAAKGWGVRSWDSIPAGAVVCEYTGLLMKTEDADGLYENDYIFDLDCLQTIEGIGGRQRRILSAAKNDNNSSDPNEKEDVIDQPEYCINAGNSGNVSRFINHSCEPNLFVQCVLNNHHDLSVPRVFLVASQNIHPLEELSYDYGYALGSVVVDGKVKELACHCGAHECRKRLY